MNAPRLLFVVALAFVLGVASTILHQRQTGIPAVAVAHTESADPSDTDDKSDAQDEAPAWPDNAPTPEQVLYSQPQMLREAEAKLMPRALDKVNLYFVAFAGDGEEDVFRNEAEYADKLLTQRFDIAGHDLLLVNNPVDAGAASAGEPSSNLESAQAVPPPTRWIATTTCAAVPDQPRLKDHLLYVNLDPLPLDQLAPEDLADALAKSGIRHKVIVISACFSGGFIDALKDGTTMLITAARADRASFGCGSESDITDFGRAVFVEGLNHTDSFVGAFAEAKRLIDAWETRDGEDHSLPQIVTSPQIEDKLKAWRNGISLGSPVPFTAPAKPSEKASDSVNHEVLPDVGAVWAVNGI